MMRDLGHVKDLAKKGLYEEALAACDALLKSGAADRLEVLRARAYVYARSDDHRSASADREAIVRLAEATIADYYHAADQALKAGDLDLSRKRFHEVLRLGDEQREQWFQSASLFYLAYIEMSTGNNAAAARFASEARVAEPNCSMPLPNRGMTSIDTLQMEIAHKGR